MGAVGQDRIISLCCVSASIILTSIHSGALRVSLPATQQTIPSPTNNKSHLSAADSPTAGEVITTLC